MIAELTLDKFQGPLELLLQLIEQEKLNILQKEKIFRLGGKRLEHENRDRKHCYSGLNQCLNKHFLLPTEKEVLHEWVFYFLKTPYGK